MVKKSFKYGMELLMKNLKPIAEIFLVKIALKKENFQAKLRIHPEGIIHSEDYRHPPVDKLSELFIN